MPWIDYLRRIIISQILESLQQVSLTFLNFCFIRGIWDRLNHRDCPCWCKALTASSSVSKRKYQVPATLGSNCVVMNIYGCCHRLNTQICKSSPSHHITPKEPKYPKHQELKLEKSNGSRHALFFIVLNMSCIGNTNSNLCAQPAFVHHFYNGLVNQGIIAREKHHWFDINKNSAHPPIQENWNHREN